MATYAAALAEQKRLLALGRRLQVRLVRKPILANDGTSFPSGAGADDYLLQIKDPRPTGKANIPGNQAASFTPSGARTVTRWHDATAAQEHVIRISGPVRSSQPGAVLGTYVGWKYYDTAAREAGTIPDSQVSFA